MAAMSAASGSFQGEKATPRCPAPAAAPWAPGPAASARRRGAAAARQQPRGRQPEDLRHQALRSSTAAKKPSVSWPAG
jgi:hypothetical protein